MLNRTILWVLLVASVAAGYTVRMVGGQSSSDLSRIFRKLDVMIPMRDGVRPHTEINVPNDSAQPLPFIFEQGTATCS